MGTGAITSYFDVAQLVLYMFWAFFAGLVYYLLRENHREGYPLDTDRGIQEGWPALPKPKTFLVPHGDHLREVTVPNTNPSPQTLNAKPMHAWTGAPLEPVGDPLTAGVGPGCWSDRHDEPDMDYLGRMKVRPLAALPEYGVSSKDTDPRGFEVIGADGQVAGVVSEMWLDTSDMLFRYFQVRLSGSGREVLVPMNFLRVRGGGFVEVYALKAAQFEGVPGIKSTDSITMLEEEKIQAYFGAGLLYADEERTEPLI